LPAPVTTATVDSFDTPPPLNCTVPSTTNPAAPLIVTSVLNVADV
jgi:hypothetical protein